MPSRSAPLSPGTQASTPVYGSVGPAGAADGPPPELGGGAVAAGAGALGAAAVGRGGGARGGGRRGLVGAEGIRVLVVAGALSERLRRHDKGECDGRRRESGAEAHGPGSVEAAVPIGYGPVGWPATSSCSTDRDWTHPQGGGTGANLYGQVAHWLQWGHRVTVVSGTYPGAAPVERPAPGLELHHMGSRVTVFPRAAWAVRRGLAARCRRGARGGQRDRRSARRCGCASRG